MIELSSVNEQIRIGRNEVVSSPKAELSLRQRTNIWAAMNDPDDTEVSFRHRVALKLMCVRRVEYVWRDIVGDVSEIDEMTSLAEDLVSRDTSREERKARGERFLIDITNRYGGDKSNYPVVMIANAVSDTVLSACYTEPDFDIADTTDNDDGMLPDLLEASYCCASAVAGALNWQSVEETDVPARRAFWLWYLDEAIPAVLAG